MPYDHLLAPIRLRGLELPNRVVFPAMATGFVALGGYVTDQLIAYHVALRAGRDVDQPRNLAKSVTVE